MQYNAACNVLSPFCAEIKHQQQKQIDNLKAFRGRTEAT